MNGLTILAGIVAMTIAVTDVTGFQCWTCGHVSMGVLYGTPGCVDDPGTKTTCGANVDTCWKAHAVGNGQEAVVRSCGFAYATGNQCESAKSGGTTTTGCVCDSDLCNSANNNGANMLFGAVMAFAVMKLV